MIDVTAQSATILPGGEILAQTTSSAHGGDIHLNIGDLTINGADDTHVSTGVFADSTSAATGSGGDISLTGQTLSIVNEAEISATTFGSGNGGRVQVNEGTIVMNGDGQIPFTGIGSDTTLAQGQGGEGGPVLVTAQSLQILNGSGIAAKTFGRGDSGDITIDTGDLFITGPVAAGITAESSRPTSGGNAGTIQITAYTVEVSNNGSIAAQAASGNAGDITINANQVSLQNQAQSTSNLRSPSEVLLRLAPPMIYRRVSPVQSAPRRTWTAARSRWKRGS